ncbi:MAG: hypothetical protein AAGF24_07270 [Cyanobacteria bacterium P01_H01_bin.121]
MSDFSVFSVFSISYNTFLWKHYLHAVLPSLSGLAIAAELYP